MTATPQLVKDDKDTVSNEKKNVCESINQNNAYDV